MSGWTLLRRSLVSHPWRWVVAVLMPLVMFPVIDITVSGWFFDPATGTFPARSEPFHEWFRRSMPKYLFAALGCLLLAWGVGELLKRPILGMTRRAAAFLVLSLALGPGLIVNVVLKDMWGRPRPSTIAEFGGPNTFVPATVFSDQCDTNCSFSSGHGALGFWPVALALLVPAPWRPWAVAAALGFGVAVGFVRIAQGGHFLSDTVFSAVITLGVIFWVFRRVVEPAVPSVEKNNGHKGGESP